MIKTIDQLQKVKEFKSPQTKKIVERDFVELADAQYFKKLPKPKEEEDED